MNAPLSTQDLFKIRITDDNYCPIDNDIPAKIYYLFFTTKPTGQGTGLGLSLSYDIIKAYSGRIKAASKEEKCSDFRIELPLNPAK